MLYRKSKNKVIAHYLTSCVQTDRSRAPTTPTSSEILSNDFTPITPPLPVRSTACTNTQENSCYMLGTDFKAGQTKFKTAAVEYIRSLGMCPKVR